MAISSDERARLRGLVAGATPGPWVAHDGWEGRDGEPYITSGEPGGLVESPDSIMSATDAAFIAESRTAVPALLDALEEAEREASGSTFMFERIRVERDHALRELQVMRVEVARWRDLASKAANGLDEWSESESCHRSDEAVAIQEALAEDRDDLRGLAEREAGR
jgi:hypothetical protein